MIDSLIWQIVAKNVEKRKVYAINSINLVVRKVCAIL